MIGTTNVLSWFCSEKNTESLPLTQGQEEPYNYGGIHRPHLYGFRDAPGLSPPGALLFPVHGLPDQGVRPETQVLKRLYSFYSFLQHWKLFDAERWHLVD